MEPALSQEFIDEREIFDDLCSRAGGAGELEAKVGEIIRDAVDYVIDSPRLRRWTYGELDPDEKTTIGKRIERLLKFELKIPNGDILDTKLADREVDIKTTKKNSWMFARNCMGRHAILIRYDEDTAIYSLGVIYMDESRLTASRNRDRKGTPSAATIREKVYWPILDAGYPANFLAGLSNEIQNDVLKQKSGAARVRCLLRNVQGVPIPRHAICSVANQVDPLKRIRANGGARDKLRAEGLLVLSGAYDEDRKLVSAARYSRLGSRETMCLSIAELSHELVRNYDDWHKNKS